jgi:hypothetical protein
MIDGSRGLLVAHRLEIGGFKMIDVFSSLLKDVGNGQGFKPALGFSENL